MRETALKLQENIKRRKLHDKPLINWWLLTIIISPITLGIAGIYFFIVRIKRADAFIIRKKEYYELLAEFSKRYVYGVKNAASYPEAELFALQSFIRSTSDQIKPIRPLLTIFLMIATFGLYFFVYAYKMNRIWNDLQLAEAGFYDKISSVWIKSGIISEPIIFNIDPSMKKSFILNLFLSALTGLWFFAWDYQVHTAPDAFYPKVHYLEDFMLSIVNLKAENA